MNEERKKQEAEKKIIDFLSLSLSLYANHVNDSIVYGLFSFRFFLFLFFTSVTFLYLNFSFFSLFPIITSSTSLFLYYYSFNLLVYLNLSISPWSSSSKRLTERSRIAFQAMQLK